MNEQLKIIIGAEIGKLKSGISKAKSEIDGLGSDAKASADKIDKAFSKAGEGIKEGLSKAGTALAGLGAGLLAANAGTMEYRQSMAQLNTAFGDVGLGADTAKKVFGDFYGLLGETDTATEASTLLSQLTQDEKALGEWTNIAAGALAKFPDSLPTEALIEASNETVKTGVVTGSLADVFNWTKVSASDLGKTLSGNKEAQNAYNKAIEEGATKEDAMNAALAACNSESEREQLLRTAMNGVLGEAGKKYQEATSGITAQRDAQLKLMDTVSKVGEAMAPVIAAFMNFVSSALEPVASKIQPLAEEYAPQLQEAMTAAGEAVGAAFGFLVDNIGIIASIAGIIGGIAAAIGLYNVVAAVKAAMDAAQVATLGALIAAQWAQAASAMAALAPYLLIVAAIAAVIAIIVLCVKHWDTIKAKVKEVAESINQKVSEMWNAIKEKFDGIKSAITEKVQGAFNTVKTKFNEIKNAIKAAVDAAKNTVSNVFNNIKTAISNAVKNAFNTVKTTFNNIKTSINTAVNSAKTTASNAFNTIKTKITNGVTGAHNKVVEKFDAIKTKINGIMEDAKTIVSNAVNKLKGMFDFSWSLPDIKLPHFNVSGGKAPWGFGGKGSLPSVSVQWYEKGGVFDKPTLFGYGNGLAGLGEAGAEAAVPLEGHPKWVKAIAREFSSQVGNRPIVMQVDGKTFAEITVDGINNWTKTTGSCPIRVS